jgi:hypothetical protein
VHISALVGTLRGTSSRCKKSKNAHGFNEKRQDGWGVSIEGAAAEMAVAKSLNIYWAPSINTYKAPDVGPYQVRWTEHYTGHLTIRGDDKLARYILVVGKMPHFRVVGWFDYSSPSVLCDEWRTNYDDSTRELVHGIPQSALRPMDELPSISQAENCSPSLQIPGPPLRHTENCMCDECCQTA